MDEHFDVVVLGAGTGGLRAAIISAKSGFRTALIDEMIGGTCLNTGCIPTKTLLHAAELYNNMKNAKEFGLKAKVGFDFNKVMNHMQDIVTGGRSHAEKSISKIANLKLIEGKAVFTGKNSVLVGDKGLSADKIIIAVGGSNEFPPIDGLHDTGFLTNETALKLQRLPKTIIMIGGGYISCEFACFFASFGSNVIILEKLDRILPGLDEDVSNCLRDCLEKQGIQIHTNVDVKQVSGKNGKKVEVVAKENDEAAHEKKLSGDVLFVSTGRRPNTSALASDAAGVKLDEAGWVIVDENLRTSNENIFAIGDVNGKSPFAHTAKREAKVALENSLLDGKKTIDHSKIPYAIFTFPTIGVVGMTSEQAKLAGIDTGVKKAYFKKNGKAKIIQDTRGFVKVIYDKKTKFVVGATIIGPDAQNIIHEFALFLNTADPKIDLIESTIHVHPTLSEVVEELREEE